MDRVGTCYGCKNPLFINSGGQWVTKGGKLQCTRGKFQDGKGHRIRSIQGPFTFVASNKKNEVSSV